jgi:hypothetical protein
VNKQKMLGEAASYSTGLLVFWCVRLASTIVQMALVVKTMQLPSAFSVVGVLMAFCGIMYAFYNVIIANRDSVRLERDSRLFKESVVRTSSLLQRSVISWVAIVIFSGGFIAMLTDSFVLNSQEKLSLWIVLDACFYSISGLTCVINNRNDAQEYLGRLCNNGSNEQAPLVSVAALVPVGAVEGLGGAREPQWKTILLELLRGSPQWLVLWIVLIFESFSLTIAALVTISMSAKLLSIVCIYVGAIILAIALVIARYYIRKGRAERFQLKQIDLVTSSWPLLTLLMCFAFAAFLGLFAVLIIEVVPELRASLEAFIVISSAVSLYTGVIGLVPTLNNWADFEIYQKGL